MMLRRERRASSPSEGGDDVWGPIAYLLAGLLAIVVFIGALPREPAPQPATRPDELEQIEQLVSAQATLTDEWHVAMAGLCNDPELQAEGIAPDCRSGAITFGDDLFDADEVTQLTEEGIRKLHVAIARMLRSLRAHPTVWSHLESIELRGHADPRARRDPYVTNMRVSQQRPMAVMFYLISDWGLTEIDRADLQNLLVLSAASYSRPPASCPEATRECYPYWRRVEMIPRMSAVRIREQLDGFVGELEQLVPTPEG